MLMKYLAIAALITSASTATFAQAPGEVAPGTTVAAPSPAGSGDQSGGSGDQSGGSGDQSGGDQSQDHITSLSTVPGEVYDMNAGAQGVNIQQSRFFQRLIAALIGRVLGVSFHHRGYNWGNWYDSHAPYSHDEGRPVSCFCESRTGHVYRGWSWTSARTASDRAFSACYWKNRDCRPMGCEY